jgi:hypothetical protein
MAMTSVLESIMVLALGMALLAFGILRKKTRHATLLEAHHAAISHHYWATGLNGFGVAVGIFLVFFGANFGEVWLYIGVTFLILSIFSYLSFEYLASEDEKQVAQLDQKAGVNGALAAGLAQERCPLAAGGVLSGSISLKL